MTFGGQSLRPKPYWPKSVQANRVHTSEHDVSEAIQTTSLILATLPARKSYVWANPDTAPTSVTSTVGTYAGFVVGDPTDTIVPSAEFSFPFMVQEGFTGIRAEVCVAAESTERSIPHALLRLTVEKLYGGATTVVSPTVRLRPGAEAFGLWANNPGEGTRWRFGMYSSTIIDITSDEYIPVTFMAAVIPEIVWEPPNSIDPYNTAGADGGTAGPAIDRTAKIVWGRLSGVVSPETPQ